MCRGSCTCAHRTVVDSVVAERHDVTRVHEAAHKVQEEVLLQTLLVELPRRTVAGGHERDAVAQQRLQHALERHRLKDAAHLRPRRAWVQPAG